MGREGGTKVCINGPGPMTYDLDLFYGKVKFAFALTQSDSLINGPLAIYP